jgi:hypothetical protein
MSCKNIKIFSNKNDVISWMDERRSYCVVAEELGQTNKRRFLVIKNIITYANDFMLKHWKLRKTHELFLEHTPSKLFFDIESTTMTKGEIDYVVDVITHRVLDKYPSKHPHAIMVFDGSRTGKQSRHVICNVGLFENIQCIASVASSLIYDDLPLDCFDLGVYIPHRSFRVPYSTGFGKETYLKLLSSESLKETPELFMLGLIQSGTDGLQMLDYSIPKSVPKSIKRTRLSNDNSCRWEMDEMVVVIQRCVVWLQNKWPMVKIHQTSFTGCDVSLQVSGICCKTKGHAHKSNTMYVTIRLSPKIPEFILDYEFTHARFAHAHFSCTDFDCKPRNYWYGGNIVDVVLY